MKITRECAEGNNRRITEKVSLPSRLYLERMCAAFKLPASSTVKITVNVMT